MSVVGNYHLDLILHFQGQILPSAGTCVTMFVYRFYIGGYAGGLSEMCHKYVTHSQ